MDLKDIIETRFDNEINCTEYLRNDAPKIINHIINNKNELQIKDQTVNYLYEFLKQIKYSKKHNAYVNNIELYNTHNTGRYYCKNKVSLQSLPSKIRNTIIDKSKYLDFDIANSAPSILLNICDKMGWKCDDLRDYCINRDDYLKQLKTQCGVSRKDAKRLFISLMFGSDYINWVKDMFNTYPKFNTDTVPKWMENIHTELYTIMDNVWNCDDFKYIKNIVKRKKKDDIVNCFVKKNPKASLLAQILFNIENVIIFKVRDYFHKNTTFVPDTPIFDGFLLRITTTTKDISPSQDEIPQHIERTQQLTKNQLDLDIKFTIKGFSEDYISQLRNLNNNDEKIKLYGQEFDADELLIGVNDETDAMNKILSFYPHFKIFQDNLYMYDDGLWTDNSNIIKTFYSKNADYIYKLKFNKITKQHDNSNLSFGNVIALRNNLYTAFKENANLKDDYLLNTRSTLSSKGKILFKNGVLSANKNGYEFRKTFDYNEIFKTRVEDDFRMTRDEIKIKEIKEIFFQRPYQENAKAIIKFLSCALFGMTLKKSLIVIGNTNSGKSSLTQIISENLSSEMIGDFEFKNLGVRKFEDNDCKHLHWVVKSAEKRLLISNESFNGKVDVEVFKNIVSGGTDIVKGRGLYQGVVEVIPKFMILSFMNPDKIPTFRGADDALKDRLMFVRMRCEYVDDKNDIEDETTQFLKINNLIEKYTTQDYKDAMRWLFIDAFIDYLNNGVEKINIKDDDDIDDIDDGLGYIREILQNDIVYQDGKHITSKQLNDYIYNNALNNMKNNNVKNKLMKDLYKFFEKPYEYKRKMVDGVQQRVYNNIEFK